jgi:hypothetical protein
MNYEQKHGVTLGVSNVLNNAGGPASRKLSQDVYSDFLANAKVGKEEGIYYLSIPANVHDLSEWLNQLARQEGFANIDEALKKIPLPPFRSMVIEDKKIKPKKCARKKTLMMALVLAKSNQFLYNPDMPLVLTKSRLERNIRLVTIQQTSFYGLDK